MNPKDVHNARTNYETAKTTGTQRSTQYFSTIETHLKQHADQLQVPQEFTLNPAEPADEKGWVRTSYLIYDIPVPVDIRAVSPRELEISVNHDTRIRIDETNTDDLTKICAQIFKGSRHDSILVANSRTAVTLKG